MDMITIEHITKDYGKHKGVFDITFSVKQGETLGFLGPNGAGKTTTIRQLMGFIQQDQGNIRIKGLDCFTCAHQIQTFTSYLPGEIAFMDDMQGMEFIHFIANMKGLKDLTKAKELMDFFELNPSGKIKKMSKGMKQKIGIICAFMQDSELLILDEPTSGLDPLMQNKFVELILSEQKKGKTILMSSHVFEEVERTCDRAAIIREGKIVKVEDVDHLRQNKRKSFMIDFADAKDATQFCTHYPKSLLAGSHVTVTVEGNINNFLQTLSNFPIKDMNIHTQTLEELFMHFYGGTPS